MYPEHDKLRAISDKSQAIGEFLEWLQDCGLDNDPDADPWRTGGRYGSVELAFRQREGVDPSVQFAEDDVDRSSDLTPLSISITDLLARYFEIDQEKIGQEKRAMIEACGRIES